MAISYDFDDFYQPLSLSTADPVAEMFRQPDVPQLAAPYNEAGALDAALGLLGKVQSIEASRNLQERYAQDALEAEKEKAIAERMADQLMSFEGGLTSGDLLPLVLQSAAQKGDIQDVFKLLLATEERDKPEKVKEDWKIFKDMYGTPVLRVEENSGRVEPIRLPTAEEPSTTAPAVGSTAGRKEGGPVKIKRKGASAPTPSLNQLPTYRDMAGLLNAY